MSVSLILEICAVIAGVTGVTTGVCGGSKINSANDTVQYANRHKRRIKGNLEEKSRLAAMDIDRLGKLEIEIVASFDRFAEIFEQIKNRPVFENYKKEDIILPIYEIEELKQISGSASALLEGIASAGIGAAAGFAAAGVVSSVEAASTIIASSGGVALTNATLSMLGGGAITAGSGAAIVGTTLVGVSTLGIGLLVGGIALNIKGKAVSEKTGEILEQMKQGEEKVEFACNFLQDLRETANLYYDTLVKVDFIYRKHITSLANMVIRYNHKEWSGFTQEEKMLTENTVLLVGLLYKMCSVALVLKQEENEMDTVNKEAVKNSIQMAGTVVGKQF